MRDPETRIAELLAANNALLERARAAEAELFRARIRIEVLRGAVLSAAQVFEGYAEIHAAKGSAGGAEKAAANRQLADKMRGVLAQGEPAA